MEHKNNKLKLDLDFLGEGTPEKSEKKDHHKLEDKSMDDTPMSVNTKWTLGATGVAVLIIIIAAVSSGGSSDITPSPNTPSPPANTKTLDNLFDTSDTKTNSTTVAELAKSANQQCKDDYGVNAYSTGEKNADGEPVCSCNDGYQWNAGRTTCVVVPKVKTSPETNPHVPVPEKTKSADEQCKDNYGVNAYSTGEKNTDGGPVCDCNDGYQWDVSRTTCLTAPKVKTGLEICQERNGVFATYDSASNSCGCASEYYLGETSQQCVSYTEARDQNCTAKWPGTSFLKYDSATGKNICDCEVGFYWNNERTACYSLIAFNQSCVNSYGTGSYSTTENGKRVCDCGSGYDWNIERSACITNASIDAMCERDVGRNSKYAGYVENGKYICTEPF